MRTPFFKRATSAAAPSAQTQLTAPLLQEFQQEQQAQQAIPSDNSQPSSRNDARAVGSGSWRERTISMLRSRAATASDTDTDAARHLLSTAATTTTQPSPIDVPRAPSVSSFSSEGSGTGNEFLEEQFYSMGIRRDPAAVGHFDASGGEGRRAAAAATGADAATAAATAAATTAATTAPTTAATTAATTSPAVALPNAMTQFLAESDGPHFYLNSIRDMLLWRQPTEDISRFLNDTLLSRWITEFDDKVSHRMPSGIEKKGAITSEEIADYEFHRLGCRMTYLELPDLPPLTDQQFTEFTDRHAQVGDGAEIARRLAQFCADVHGR